jgi:hypothetical protein
MSGKEEGDETRQSLTINYVRHVLFYLHFIVTCGKEHGGE